MHLTEEMYLLLLQDVIAPSQLVTVAHSHVLEKCDRCKQEWDCYTAASGEESIVAAAPREVPVLRSVLLPVLPKSDDALSVADCDHWKELVSRMRRETRKAREDVNKLLELPEDQWTERVKNARTRFRSRAFAQHLLTRCREQVRTEPRVAARFTDLVPLVLHRLPGAETERWGVSLRLRAAAYCANAERVAGDLTAAAHRFAALRIRLQELPSVDDHVWAEIDSLEASLCIDQRRFEEAERLLARAAAGARRAGHRRVLCRALVKTGTLLWTRGLPERALESLEAAARELDPDDRSYDRACLVANRVMVLCELEQYAEAEDRLDEAEPLLRMLPHSEAYMAGIRGRVALGLERWSEAADRFRTARSILLDLERDYDAALVSLDLAHAHLAAGDTERLRKLATRLVPMFQTRDVERETLAVLRLVAEAVAQDRATVGLLTELRQRLHAEHP